MKISEWRSRAYKYMNMPPHYKGDVMLPSQMRKDAGWEQDVAFLIFLGELSLYVLNRRIK